MSVIFPPAFLERKWLRQFYILFFMLENPHAHKIPRLRFFLSGRGGSANFIFMGAGIFLKMLRTCHVSERIVQKLYAG